MPPPAPILRLGTGPVTVDVAPVDGGRIAQIVADGTALLVGHEDVPPDALSWGSFPMVPWAGRIRDGRFRFRGVPYQLPRNQGPHAMHGVGFTAPWDVADRATDAVELRLDLAEADGWPFGGHVTQTISVDERAVHATMTVHAGAEPFPASFGWHPWFRKPERIDFHPIAMYRRDEHHIAVDELVAVPNGPWDDCFLNDEPVGMRVGGVEVLLTSPCRHWVVYDEPQDATCVEPQTGPPDAFNIAPRIVAAGDSLTASFRLDVT